MATFKLIEGKTLSSAVSSVEFASIPQTYTDLKLILSVRDTYADTRTNFNLTINSNSTSYSWYGMYGYGSTSGSNSGSGSGYRIYGNSIADNNTANLFSNAEIYFTDYTSTTKRKPAYCYSVVENNGTSNFTEIDSTIFNNTGAITNIVITNSGSSNFKVNSTFYLYGIKNS